MAPNLIGNSFILAETALVPETVTKSQTTPLYRGSASTKPLAQNGETNKQSMEVNPIKKDDYKMEIVWKNAISFIIIHLFALYGLYITITERLFIEYIWGQAVAYSGAFGITVGAHRLWTHRCYKAKLPLRILLMVLQTIAFQNHIYEWARDHRAHHKFTDTDADPHNSKRGFFFCHMGWLMVKKHPDVIRKGKTIDMSDLEADPVVMFQKRYYTILMPLLCFILPCLIPYFCMGVNFRVCFFCCSIYRWVFSLHITWLVNSAAHMWGMKPYDKNMSPTDGLIVGAIAFGEGWHNYHHVFPWDYKAGELGNYSTNLSTGVIDFFAKIGHTVGICGGFGVTVGAHRLWSHRSYKAKLPLRILLMIFQTIAFQNHIYEWVRDHRAHHKFTDTDADPHNSKRGFFFCHMGWLMVKKHPEVMRKGKAIDMSDLEADPVIMFQKRYYMILMPLLCFILPCLIPYFVLGVNFRVCFFCCSILRWVISLHFTWLVNSAAHMWGMKPYDKNMSPTDNLTVGILASGEGWHNYHHVFPWDYKAGELGNYSTNLSTGVIDFFAKIGWAYDLKVVSDEMIRKRIKRTGDGSHIHSKNQEIMERTKECNNNNNNEEEGEIDDEQHFWGWNDKDVTDKDRKSVSILHTRKK